MGSGSLAGMEVPIIGSDSVNWIEVSVPSSTPPSAASQNLAPPTQDAASCSVVGDPPTYLIWRIHKSTPHVLELLELCACKEFPKVGLRILFSDALCPFAYICRSEIEGASGVLYFLYALTVSGVAYIIKLKSVAAYSNCSVFQLNETMEFNLQANSSYGAITAVAATTGSLVIGRTDGSVGCVQLGMLDQNAPGFVHELRDDSGIGRLWGLMSRGRSAGDVQDLVILEFQGKKLLFVLHSNGILQVWDLLDHSKVFSQTLSSPILAGAMFARLWVGDIDVDTNIVPLAVLYRGTAEVSLEMLSTYSFHFRLAGNTSFLETSMYNIPLDEGRLIDAHLNSKKILVLKDSGLTSYSLSHTNGLMEDPHEYSLQETVVADQLFQSSKYSSDDLLRFIHCMYSSIKDRTASFVSSIFLRRLLIPGVHHKIVLRATFQDYNKHWTDSEFQSFTVDGLKKEILLLIEHEGFSGSLTSICHRWKKFCTRYFHNWCKNNVPYSFLVEASSGAAGLIRKNSISLFRSLEDIELLIYGSIDDPGDFVGSGLQLSDHESEILVHMLRCVDSIGLQLGKAVSAVFYESLVSMPTNSYEDVIPYLLKVLETGFSSSAAALHISDVGLDIAREKEVADHKNLRKFSVDMVLSLHALRNKGTTWKGVLNVIERFLKFLVPCKITQNLDLGVILNIKTSVLVQATSQVAEVMFQSALDILVLLSYLVDLSGQIHMSHDDITRIQVELVPMVQEIVIEWIVIHYFGITACEPPAVEDFSSRLSSLQIDGSIEKRSWKEGLGKCDFVLAFILLLNSQSSTRGLTSQSLRCLPNPRSFISSVRGFASWIIWGTTSEDFSNFFNHGTEIAVILLRHGQYDAVEFLLSIMDAHSREEKVSECFRSLDSEWFTQLHLLGCCFLAQAHYRLQGTLKERKLCEAVRCFFRASSGHGAPQVVQKRSYELGLPPVWSTGSVPAAAWRLQYYQWIMQIFEQYSFNEGACQFALAALEQVDEAFRAINDSDEHLLSESAMTVKGRLWANVFKFSIDLNNFNDAYCSIISNLDEESKNICIRRLIIVLYERCAIKVLCGGEVPFIGLTEQVERELAWKAERSDISAKPSPYKLLYAFEMHRNNWRRAAGYIYQYTTRLKTEASLKDYQDQSLTLQERLNGLSAAINALHLVHPAYAWIDPPREGNFIEYEHYPSKKSKKSIEGQSAAARDDVQPQILPSYLDGEKLEKEFVLTSAEYMLSMVNVKWSFNGVQNVPSDLVNLLIQMNFHDMAFTVLLKFWKGSRLRRELERVFIALSLKCCPNRADSSSVGNDFCAHGLLLTASKDETSFHGSTDENQQYKGNSQWETLELYLEKYEKLHPTLPIIVAETLLATDPQIELPLWLVNMFKAGRGDSTFGMTGSEASPASLFRVYVDYGRYTEATSLVLDYMERLTTVRPGDIIRRKRPSAVWFPHTAIERLWCQLDELISLGHLVDHYDNLRKLLRGALLRHLNLLKLDSDDAIACSRLRNS